MRYDRRYPRDIGLQGQKMTWRQNKRNQEDSLRKPSKEISRIHNQGTGRGRKSPIMRCTVHLDIETAPRPTLLQSINVDQRGGRSKQGDRQREHHRAHKRRRIKRRAKEVEEDNPRGSKAQAMPTKTTKGENNLSCAAPYISSSGPSASL